MTKGDHMAAKHLLGTLCPASLPDGAGLLRGTERLK